MWMVVGVHNRTTNGRSDTHVTFPSCFTDVDQVVLAVAYDADGCTTVDGYHSHLTRWHTQCSVFSFFCHKLCTVACGADQLASLACIQLYVVNQCTNRDILQRQAVAHMHLCFRTIHNNHAVRQTLWCKNICFFAVCIADQCDISGSVRIVLDSDHFCRNPVFPSLEINDSVFSLMSASAVSYCDLTLCITSGIFLKRTY